MQTTNDTEKTMRKFIFIASIGIMLAQLMGCESKRSAVAETPADLVARGRYLVTISGCHDCHSPKIFGPHGEMMPDSTRLLSGHPAEMSYPIWKPEDMQNNAVGLTNAMLTTWAGPWGVSFAANITPDQETGIAEWTEETYVRALRTGRHQGQPNGRMMLPPMPWPNFAQMTDSDLKAMWTYLRSIPPVKNQVPLPVPPETPLPTGN